MGVIGLVGKLVLVIVNMLIVLLSLALIIVGIIIVAGKDIYNDLLDNMQTKLDSSANQLGANVDTSDLSLSEFLLPVAYALIVVGIVMGVIAMLGCIGGCYTLKIVLIVYVIITSVIFLVQAIIVIAVYVDKSTFDSTVKPYIKDTLENYAGIEDNDEKGLAWNALMNYEECCGVDDYNDFQGLTNWPPSTIGGSAVTGLQTPVICCITKSTNYNCAKTPTDATNYWKTGCYDKFFDLILSNALVITVIVLFLASQFVLIFFTIWILCTMDNKIDII